MSLETVAQNQNKACNYSTLGIYAETDPLRRVALWGPVGAEAVLAQLYPPAKSLFHSDMSVPVARNEAIQFANLLRNHGVQSIFVRDQIAAALPVTQVGVSRVRDFIRQTAEKIRREHTAVTNSRYFDLMAQVDYLIDTDTERYGEDKALALNKRLCIDPLMPLGNLMYARDQMNIVLDTRVSARMRKPIRVSEVSLFDQVYQDTLGPHKNIVIPYWESLEGGDIYIHDKVVYVGVGPRTTLGAAQLLYTSLESDLQILGYRMAIVEDEDYEKRPHQEQMDFMHLDTFSGPIGKKEVAICEEEASRREVKFFTRRGGAVELLDNGLTFTEHLARENELVIISREEQQSYGCNFLALDDQKIVVPLDSNTYTNSAFESRGKVVIPANLHESTKGYGAAHCMTGQLYRENSNGI